MSKRDKPVALTENHESALAEARDRRTQSLESEVATLRRRLEEAQDRESAALKAVGAKPGESLADALTRVGKAAAESLSGLEADVARLRVAQPPPPHAVRAFEAGARAERARVLEQGRIELLSWPNGTPERRALDALRKALQDERLPLPEFKL